MNELKLHKNNTKAFRFGQNTKLNYTLQKFEKKLKVGARRPYSLGSQNTSNMHVKKLPNLLFPVSQL